MKITMDMPWKNYAGIGYQTLIPDMGIGTVLEVPKITQQVRETASDAMGDEFLMRDRYVLSCGEVT